MKFSMELNLIYVDSQSSVPKYGFIPLIIPNLTVVLRSTDGWVLMKKVVVIGFTHGDQLEGELEKSLEKDEQSAVKPIEKLADDTIVEKTAGNDVDPLGDDFEKLPEKERRSMRMRTESAAIRRLRAGEGVISDLPKETAEEDDIGVMAAVAVDGLEIDEIEPSYEQTQRRSDWPQWKEAIDVELQNLKAAGTWEVVERPNGVNVVDSKWVFWLKKDVKYTE